MREYKRLTLLCGHYGSGKTNVAVNMAYELAERYDTVTVADLDIVNPYFRTKDSAEVLDAAGGCGGFNLQWAWSSGHLAGLLQHR